MTVATSRAAFDRAAMNEFEVRKYGIPLIEYRPKQQVDVPLSYVLNIDVEAGVSIGIEYFYITMDEEMPHLMEWVRKLRVFGYDLETSDLNPMDGKIATIQVGNPICPIPRAYMIDARCVSREALQQLLELLQDPSIVKLGQNMKFECKWTQHHYATRVPGLEFRGLRGVADCQVTELVCRTGILNAKNKGPNRPGKGEDRAAYKHTSMAKLCARHLKIDIDKDHDLRTSFYKTPKGEHTLRQIVYGNSDVVYVFYIAQKQKPLIESRKLKAIVKIEYHLIPVLADMELTGLRMDTKRWRQLWQEAIKGRAEAERKLDDLLLSLQGDLFGGTEGAVRPMYYGKKRPEPINYSSSNQVKWAIKFYCEATGWRHEVITDLKTLKKRKLEWGKAWLDQQAERGRNVTEEDIPDWVLPEDRICILTQADKNTLILRKCRGQLPRDIVDLLLEYSLHDIRCDTFGNDFLVKHLRADTGCVHTEFHQCVTATGRLSSTPNLQNIPNDPRYRRCFIPLPGYVFVTCDYSQVEPRISAQLSGDDTYTLTFLHNEDLYSKVAEAMTGEYPNKKTPEGKLTRAIFKTVVLALAYSMGPAKLRDRLTIALHKEIMAGTVPAPSLEYARELYERFFEVHAKIREAQQAAVAVADPATSTRKIWDDFLEAEITWVTAPCGRKRFFPPDALAVWTEAPNVGPQSGSATITKAAAVMLMDLIDAEGFDAHLVNLVHDEIVCMVRADHAEAFAPKMKELLEAAGQFYCPDIPIKAEYPEGSSNGITHYWAKAVDAEEEAQAEAELLAEAA